RNDAQAPSSASGITEAKTQNEEERALAAVRPSENPARFAATPEIAAPAAAPVWRTAVMADDPMARSSSESAARMRRLMNAQEKPKATPSSDPPVSTQTSGPSAMLQARITRLAIRQSAPNRVQRASQIPVAWATAMPATVQAS